MTTMYAPKMDIAARHEEFKERMETIPVYRMGIKLHEFDEARLALTREYATQIIDDVHTIDKELELAEQATKLHETSEHLIRYNMPHASYQWYDELERMALTKGLPGVDHDEIIRNDSAYGGFFCKWLVGKRKEYLEAERYKLTEIFENLDWQPGTL